MDSRDAAIESGLYKEYKECIGVLSEIVFYYKMPVFWKDGQWVLYRDYMIAPTKGLVWDPCPFGLPVIWTGAHMTQK